MLSALLLSEGSALLLGPGIRLLLSEDPSEAEPLIFEVELESWLIESLGVAAWPGLIPQKTALPALVYAVTSVGTELDLSGTDELRAWTVQFDAWGKTRLEVATLIARLEGVLLDYTGPMGRAWVENATLDTDGHGYQPPADASDRPLQRKTAEYLIQFRDNP